MQTSQAGLEFIARNEGFRPQIYNDNGKPAIGYGHDLLPGESFPNGITTLQARLLQEEDVAKIDALMAHLVPPDCTQNQWDACADFAYNLGLVPLGTMLAHGWDQVPVQMLRWDHKKNTQGIEVVDADLTARRQAEVALFNS